MLFLADKARIAVFKSHLHMTSCMNLAIADSSSVQSSAYLQVFINSGSGFELSILFI